MNEDDEDCGGEWPSRRDEILHDPVLLGVWILIAVTVLYFGSRILEAVIRYV